MIEVVTTNLMTHVICICSDEILNVYYIFKSVEDFTNIILFINKFQLKYL